jgi:hypothetical protein
MKLGGISTICRFFVFLCVVIDVLALMNSIFFCRDITGLSALVCMRVSLAVLAASSSHICSSSWCYDILCCWTPCMCDLYALYIVHSLFHSHIGRPRCELSVYRMMSPWCLFIRCWWHCTPFPSAIHVFALYFVIVTDKPICERHMRRFTHWRRVRRVHKPVTTIHSTKIVSAVPSWVFMTDYSS